MDNAKYRIRHFTDEDGLPQNSIKSIVPDKNGFVWLATEFGLVRFDGTSFHVFGANRESLLTNRIACILPSGMVDKPVAVTGNGNLIWADETTAVVNDPGIKNSIYVKGHLTDNKRGQMGAVKIYTSIGLPDFFTSRPPSDYYGIPLDTATYYLVGRDSVLFFHHQVQHSYYFPRSNELHFFEAGRHLYYWNGKEQPVLFKDDSIKTVKIKGDILSDAAYKTNSQAAKIFWNITAGQLFFFIAGNLYFVKALPDGALDTKIILAGFDMEEHEIAAVYYQEITRRIFMGSFARGLFVARQKDFEVSASPGHNEDVFYAQAVYDSNKVITPRGYILDPAIPGSRMPVFASLATDDQYSLLIAADKTIWVKTGSAIYHLNAHGTTVLHRWNMDATVTQLYEDKEGRILFGLVNGGLYYVRADMKAPELVLPGPWDISYIQQQDTDVCWIGTGNGCYRFHWSAKKVDTVPGTKGKYIRSLLVYAPHEVWITTYGAGAFLYNGSTLVALPVDKKGYLKTAHCILEDNKGYFWITTNRGLFQAARQDLLHYATGRQEHVFYQYYEKNSGFNSNEFNGGCEPCGVKLPNGYFSFPSLNGLVWFRPDSLYADVPDKGLFVDRVEVNLEARDVTDTVRLDNAARRIRFFVTTPYFGNDYNLHIEYALLQNDQDTAWLPVDDDRSVTLSPLASGAHELLIRKWSGFGKDNFAYKSIILTVPPLFYEKAWFQVLLVLGCIGLVWAYIAFRLRYIRHKNKMLEGRIADRTKELEQTMLALRDSEHDLRRQTQIQDRLITAMAHDIKSPLKFMADSAKRIMMALNKSGAEQEREEAQVLYESGTRVYYYTDNLLQYIRSQTRHNKVVMKPVNLTELVQEKINIFQSMAAELHTEIQNLLPPDLFINSNGNLLGVVIHNLLDNAVKITIDGKITVEATVEGPQCTLSFKDTGIGMRPELVEWSNRADNEDITVQERMAGHTGMGLLIVKDLLVLINARLLVQRRPEKGTEIRIIMENAPLQAGPF